jgi:hypothetical protein
VKVRNAPVHLGLRDLLEQRRIEFFHGRQRLAVHILRSVGMGIMGKVGAGHDQGAAVFQNPGQGLAEPAAQADVRRTDHGRHNPGVGKKDLDKGQLDLYGMFLLVQGFVEDAIRISGQQGLYHLFIDHRCAERCAEAVPGIDGNFPERSARMIRPENDDNVVWVVRRLPEAVGGNLARKNIPGMGNDNGQRIFDLNRHGIVHKLPDSLFQRRCRRRIESARHKRETNIIFLFLTELICHGTSLPFVNHETRPLKNGFTACEPFFIGYAKFSMYDNKS